MVVHDDGKYELVMGERRLRATQQAGLAAIPAIIRRTEEADLLKDALLENLHRAQLNPLEEAAAYQRCSATSIAQGGLCRRSKRFRPQSNTVRLLQRGVSTAPVAAVWSAPGLERLMLSRQRPPWTPPLPCASGSVETMKESCQFRNNFQTLPCPGNPVNYPQQRTG